jgi:acetyl-CoA carboxylase beta subunit
MDFRFMGGSMGSVVGEKLTRLIEHAHCDAYPLSLFARLVVPGCKRGC